MNFKMNQKYKTQLLSIDNAKEHVRRHQEYVDKYEYKLYGSKDSPFYGLKYPTLFKICEYLCDEYKIPYDLMMDKIYDIIMKNQYESAFKFIDFNNRFTYDTWYGAVFPYSRQSKYWNEERNFRGFKGRTGVRPQEHLYIGSLPYRTRQAMYDYGTRSCIVSDITYKSKKQVSDEGIGTTFYVNTITKQKIIEELNKIGIKYRLNMKKEELMKLLVKNK